MADDETWLLKEDGYLNLDCECKSIIYHPNLNVVLITTGNAQVCVFDVNSGLILQRSFLSGKSGGKLQGIYLADGIDKVLYTDGRGIGVRSDYNGVLLLDTILQTPVIRSEDIIKLEILLSEAILLYQCLRCIDLPGADHLQEVLQELSTKIHSGHASQKKGIKAQKWNTICLELPHGALKLVCSGLVMELKKQTRHIPALPIASAINERLNGLMPSVSIEGRPVDRALMFSEAARRDTFSKWPHMNYRWAFPDQMAQAGFYHQPNSTGDDRAMCFTCNVCLVCWEPTDEPWSEHERHTPTCPFVKGEYTQNVPLSVTLATAPAQISDGTVEIIGTTNSAGLVSTGSSNGLVNVWNVRNQLKREASFYIALGDQESNNKQSMQFFTMSLDASIAYDTEASTLNFYKSSASHRIELTSLSIIGPPKPPSEDINTESLATSIPHKNPDNQIRPCLVSGILVSGSNASQARNLENVWASSTDLASSSSLVQAMNSVNSAANDRQTIIDIMKVASDSYQPAKMLYLVLCDFHHKATAPLVPKKDETKQSKSKKTLSGTGTSTSSNDGRQESLYQELFLSKFLLEDLVEDVDSEMLVGTHFDNIFPTTPLTASSSNGICPTPLVPPPGFTFDANFNPINGQEQFPSNAETVGCSKKIIQEVTKTTKMEPIVIQSVKIDAPENMRISYTAPTKDGKHLYVALSPIERNEASSGLNTIRMDIDEESEFFPQKSFMYWDHNETQGGSLSNGETRNEDDSDKAILLIYALDFTDKVVRLMPDPIVRQELPGEKTPLEHVLLPIREKNRNKAIQRGEPFGRVALVCKDGVVRVVNLSNLKTVAKVRLEGQKFVSAAYCTSLERLCACTSNGALHFFATMEEDEIPEEIEETEDLKMITEISCVNERTEPSTSTSSIVYQEPIIALRNNLSYADLKTLYELTQFDKHSPAYRANVPPCWSEMMQAQRQRHYPQHLHQAEDQHHTRTWRLQNDASTWDEHIFELTLPRNASGVVGHVDVKYNLHSPCTELPAIQVTLLKQSMFGIGNHKTPITSVDERIDFSLGVDQKGENPVVTEEYQRQHNTEVLCGPINLQRCMDLSDHSGCATLTSPKLFRARSNSSFTLLVHIKALVDPVKEGTSSKSRINVESKPPTSKKLRIDEAGPLLPGASVERYAANASKKNNSYIGCDWIHEISISVRKVLPTSIPHERLQRCAMLESKQFINNLLSVACLQTSDKSSITQSIALDILIWVVAIRLTRLRTCQNSVETKAMQLETVRCVQGKLAALLRTCLLCAGRSISHKCIKLVVLCSEGLHNLDDPLPHSFEEAVLAVCVTLLPSIVSVQWAGSLRWFAILITRLLPLDRNHSIAQQCISLMQQIATEMSNRVNPHHLLLATRFGLYNSPFETELFDMDPPVPPKFSSTPVTYASAVSGEPATTSITATTSSHSQDSIDLRDLLTLPSHHSSDTVVPSKLYLKTLSANHSMKGLLEVEPLHFTCHAASDGTKMEKIDTGANNLVNMAPIIYDSPHPGSGFNSGLGIKIIQHSYNLDDGSLGPDLQAKFTTLYGNLINHCKAEITKKPTVHLSLTPDDRSISDEVSMPDEAQYWHILQNDSSHVLDSTITKEKSSGTNIGTSTSKNEDNCAKKRDEVYFPWGRLLCWPPQQALVVERMHSGARRFVILDFGSPVLLTDLMIPSCVDLVSLSIDIWNKSEELDGTRLAVAGDIGYKPLVISDLQPPPVCRYLKITMIGRYGMTTTRCKIPLGMFYGHLVILPGEDYSELKGTQSSLSGTDANMQATIESQCQILSALAEDVQCRFSLATEKLKSFLDPLLCTETPNVVHMQHYLCHNKNSPENKEQPSAKILATYQECIMFQHQLNVVRGVWRRLESWRGPRNAPSSSLASASSDKLRILGESLLDILLYTVYEIGPVPSVPTSLYEAFTPSICERLFKSICVVTPAPRLQLHAVALLARMAGHQPWWGNFLANTLTTLFTASSTHIFPQDRVFILLTFLGRKSLIAGANKSSVVDAMVRTLGRLLAPISNREASSSCQLDTTLISWVLLFLSVCLDTTASHSQYLEDNHEKNKEQGVSSRWDFIHGESAMQRKYLKSNRSATCSSHKRKLQKRLMHHKQQLQDFEQAKKAFQASSQARSALSSQAANLSSKLEAALKSQERFFKKTLKQHSVKHIKDLLSMSNELYSSRSSRIQSHPSGRSESTEPEIDYTTNLSHQNVLPVARGLVALIINNSANMDMFLLACKVVARLVVSTRPAISLGELMTEEQLLKLVKLATGASDTAWSIHAVSCLLQDLLEGGRLYPRLTNTHKVSPSEEIFDSLGGEEARAANDEEPAPVAGTSNSSSTLGADEGFADGDDDTQDSIIVTPVNASTSKSNGFNLPSLFESDDSELEVYLDDILERGKSIMKKGGTIPKYPSSSSSWTFVSLAVDARLEYGVETAVEIALRRLSTLGAYNLPLSLNATIQIPSETTTRNSQSSSSRQNPGWNDRSQETWNSNDSVPSSLMMLTRCFDKIFSEMYIQRDGTSFELVLQLWLTLNLDASAESSNSSQFDTSLTPVIPLSSTAISGIISVLSWHSCVSLRAWCHALQCLTLASNQPLQNDAPEAANCSTPLDGLLGGMAGCIVKERNMGPMLLRLLSGSGLNVDKSDKQYGMAGPIVCQALQDFLVRLELWCDVITPGSSLGNALKELLLWLVYQLVQPGGPLAVRRGPLDAQCKLITSLLNLNFSHTDLGTAMSITECVSELVSTYVRGYGVEAQCRGLVDSANQSNNFGGLYACVLGGDARQTRPASWDSLIVALIKLVCRLVQTPLPSVRSGRSDSVTDPMTDMELGEVNQRSGGSKMEAQSTENTSQTDESKVAEQQGSMRLQQSGIPKPRVPCVADTVLQHEPTMMRLLGALGHSTGSSLAMLLGEGSASKATADLGDPPSIPDATFQLLSTLTKKASSPTLVLNPVYQYLASSCGRSTFNRQLGMMQLSEPLLWYILRVLDNETSLAIFTAMGGVKVLCENLVKSSKANNEGGYASPGVIALVMQHLSNSPNLASSSGNGSGLVNFAPLGTITWVNSTAQPADVLIQSPTPQRRTRTAAWTYHFYPDEAWVDLTITLKCAILLKEVELQPHVTSLATCPSAVALEIAREANSAMTPVCPPMSTSGLTFIKITLSQPKVATAVLVRLYKPKDSADISLSNIQVLGTTAFGDTKSTAEALDEEQLTKKSLGWLRLLHQCLSVSAMNCSLAEEVLNSAASVEGLVESCCNLLLLPAPSLFTSNLERVLFQLGLHSRKLGLLLINLLLNNRSAPLFQASTSTQETSTAQMVIELLQQLCCSQDAYSATRMAAVLEWLEEVALNSSNQAQGQTSSPPAVYIHCISSVIWKVSQLEPPLYNLSKLLTDKLFDALYQWTLVLDPHSALKEAIDSVLCAFCYVQPYAFFMLFQRVRIFIPAYTDDHHSSASISDDTKESEIQTDDTKSGVSNTFFTMSLMLSENRYLNLTEGQLLSIAAVSRSPTIIENLIQEGLPSFLIGTISEFCVLEQAKFNRQLSSSEAKNCEISGSARLTDNDKAAESQHQNNNSGLCMTEPESIAVVLEFFSLVCSEGRMRDWLGKEGSEFWLPLLSLLSNRPIENPSTSLSRNSKTSLAYGTLESAMIKFLSRCCWCHPANQKLLAELLTDVILQHRTPPNVRYLHGISGFTRRLILQLLLEGEKVLVSVTSETPMKISNTVVNYNMPVIPPHPAHPLGHYHQLLYMSTQATVADILQQVSGTRLLLLLPNCKRNEASTSGINHPKELWETDMSLVADTLSVAAGNTAKDKRAKEASNRSQARGPVIRKSRLTTEGTSSKSSSSLLATSHTNLANQQYLIHSSHPNIPLPSDLTIAQLLSIAADSGVSLSDPCLHLILRQRSKDSKDDLTKNSSSTLLNHSASIDSSLEVFSSGGGLAVLAKHLPLVYPDSGRPSAVVEKSPSPEQTDAEWVKIEPNEYEYDLEDGGPVPETKATPPTPSVPPHSLTAFGLFLRLPGYSEVLLRDRKRAQCLLRLALGVTDDGEGGEILTSPIATSLPTLPFQVLKQLLEDTPPTTDDGLLLRRTIIDVGAVLLLLNCFAIFTHQTGQSDMEAKSGQGNGRSDDKSHLYWAKGTGFGTGSTTQSWNVEQALLRQRSEEEHVTVLLQVLASYIGAGDQPQKELPSQFPELLSTSCLIPALSSYLRNDSVLDMARHIPLYKAVLQLLRAMALTSQLAPLLLPGGDKATTDPSIVSLLSSMRICVDTYMSKINRTRGSKKNVPKYPEHSEDDEGLATLISDIQESSIVVENATARLTGINDERAGPSPSAPELPLRSIEQRYLEVMKRLQFDTFEMITENPDGGGYKFAVSYHFESNMRATGERSHPTRVKRLAQEAVTLSTALPLSYSSSVFVRCDTDRLDVMKVLITGPVETPYANGCFEFDVYFPAEYPNSPMMINLETTGCRTVRFNPNLYNDGKVCLSVLNTWHGRPEEKWNAHTSSFLQVLVSIQSLILVSEPYFNEPGYERSRGTPSGAQSSQEYNANICQATAKWAMLDQIRNPCPCFKEVIHTHFWLKRHEIVAQIEGWIRDMEMHGADRRSGRTISLNALALRRHYRLLREELNKLPTPDGLEDLVEPLPSPGSPIELSGTPGTPSSPPTSVVTSTTAINAPLNNPIASMSNASAASLVHHEIDTDVEMEKMVSKVCE